MQLQQSLGLLKKQQQPKLNLQTQIELLHDPQLKRNSSEA